MLGHVPFKDVADGVQVGAAIVIDHALGIAGGAGRVVQRDGVPLVGRRLPVERGGAAARRLRNRSRRAGRRARRPGRAPRSRPVREFGAARCASSAYSVSMMRARASPWPSMNSTLGVSSRVFSVLSTAPSMGTPKCASTMAGMFGSMTATVSPRLMPACASACGAARAQVWRQLRRTVDHGEPVAVHFGRAGDEVHRRERLVVGVATAQPMVVHAAHCLCLLPARLPALSALRLFWRWFVGIVGGWSRPSFDGDHRIRLALAYRPPENGVCRLHDRLPAGAKPPVLHGSSHVRCFKHCFP